MEYELTYPNKKKKEDILKKTEATELHLLKHGGNTSWYSDWENLLIYGNNLNILKALTKNSTVDGNVKLVYIDPPFSTNQTFRGSDSRTATISSSDDDELAYDDLLIGADFLEFIRERLIFLREVLSDEGSIYLHIDCKRGHYLKILMDEVFGEENFRNDITRIKCSCKNFDRKGYGNVKDMVLFYTKTANYTWNDSREDYTDSDIAELFSNIDPKNGKRYTTTPLHAPGETKNGNTGKEWKGLKPPTGRHWRYPPEELDKLEAQGLIEWSKNGNPRKIIYAEDAIKKKKKRQDIWKFKDPFYPKYPTEKNCDLLKTIIEASSNPDDLVLDCFSGSGTTLAAAEKTGRRWIGIDQSERAIKATITKLNAIKDCKKYALYSSTKEQPINF